MNVYISGPVTGTSDYDKRFAKYEEILSDAGHNVINPVRRLSHLPEETPWAVYMLKCVELLKKADAVYFMEGYRRSTGAMLELAFAEAAHLDIYMPSELDQLTSPYFKESKFAIAFELCSLLQCTHAGSDIDSIAISDDGETATVIYDNGGTKEVNIAADSGIAMIKDIIRAVAY